MKINTLIKRLQKASEKYGNLNVTISDRRDSLCIGQKETLFTNSRLTIEANPLCQIIDLDFDFPKRG